MGDFQDTKLIQIDGCEVCGETELKCVLDLGLHPLCDDLIPVGHDRISEEYPISLSYCEACRTVHQNFQIPKHLLFPNSYHYRARHTKDVLDGMRMLVERCKSKLGSLENLTVLDIGCNDGSLLSIFSENDMKTIGIEPTGAAADARKANHVIYEDYLNRDLAKKIVNEHGRPDIITFTNVFAHIENLSEVLDSLRQLLDEHTLLVIENHYLGAVLDRYQFDTFYHEHPRTYSKRSFDQIAKSLGTKIVSTEFPARYGGNIRVLLQANKAALETEYAEIPAEHNSLQRLCEMNERIPRWQDAKRRTIEKLVEKHGPLSAKAFPGRAAILIKLLKLDETMVSAVYEKPGSMKIGHYVPGTRIPILSDDDFLEINSSNAPLLNFAWHISSEIHQYMRASGFKGEIVDLFSPAEFEEA